jgi:hypothetical protein
VASRVIDKLTIIIEKYFVENINDVILFVQYKIDKPVNEEEEEEDEDDEDGFRAGRGKKDEEEDDPVASESFPQNTAFFGREKNPRFGSNQLIFFFSHLH